MIWHSHTPLTDTEVKRGGHTRTKQSSSAGKRGKFWRLLSVTSLRDANRGDAVAVEVGMTLA